MREYPVLQNGIRLCDTHAATNQLPPLHRYNFFLFQLATSLLHMLPQRHVGPLMTTSGQYSGGWPYITSRHTCMTSSTTPGGSGMGTIVSVPSCVCVDMNALSVSTGKPVCSNQGLAEPAATACHSEECGQRLCESD